MAKLERVEHKVFASKAPLEEIGQFGSAIETTKLNTKDIATIQGLPAYEGGWGSAVVSENNYPTLEEMNGVLNVMSYQTGYLYQEGIPSWTATQEYTVSSIVKDISGSKLYKSLQDNNKGHALQEDLWWKELELGGGGGLKVGTVLTGFIDESENKERYLNGGTIIQDQFASFTKWIKNVVKLYPSLNVTESQWQAELKLSTKGQCGKFVIDDSKGTIRLPKVVNIQGLFDLSHAGKMVEAGLPNITGTAPSFTGGSGTGALYISHAGSHTTPNAPLSHPDTQIYGFDASRSNPIYGKSTSVQEEAIQYPYYIVVATGSVESIDVIREAELNNPFSLFDCKWSDKLLNNLSWLRSNGQWNAKEVYPDAYDYLLKQYNAGSVVTEEVAGISITYKKGKDSDIRITTDTTAYSQILQKTGTAWFYVLNLSVSQFMLPQSNAMLQFGGKGNFIEAGIPNIEGSFSAGGNGRASGAFSYIGENGGRLGGHNANNPNCVLNASKSSPVYGKSKTVQPNAVGGYLYFYVGETVQNANLINAGRIEEFKANTNLGNVTEKLDENFLTKLMPDYSAGVGAQVARGTWVQCPKDSFVVTYGNDSYTEDYYAYVSPDKTNEHKYIVGRRYDDVNANTQSISFTFFVPKGWYFQNNAENQMIYRIYPLKGAN